MNARLSDLADIFKGPTGFAIGAIIVAVLYYTYESLQGASGGTADGAPPATLSGSGSEQLSAIPTGLNSLTPSVYGGGTNANPSNAPVGIFGILGSVTNDLLGGAPADFGNWIGEHVSTANPNQSLNIAQSWSGNPYGAGPHNGYADAVDSAPIDATFAATPFVTAQVPAGG
jgi:hypothetical protein